MTTSSKMTPRHVAIIMDGNGRWAKTRGLNRWEGHAEGAKAVREAVETAVEAGVEYLTLYAFSIANWQRPRIEVEALMRLLTHFAKKEREELLAQGVNVQVIGNLDDLPLSTRRSVDDLMKYTAGGKRMTLSLALSYGGRQDLIEAARALAVRVRAGMILPEEIDENALRMQMTTRTLPDVDLLIRTGGEQRVSDFLLLESAYAELMFLPVMWPEFNADHFQQALSRYGDQERRFGLTGDQIQSGVPTDRSARPLVADDSGPLDPFDPGDAYGRVERAS